MFQLALHLQLCDGVLRGWFFSFLFFFKFVSVAVRDSGRRGFGLGEATPHLQVVALHQAARLQRAAVREEGRLHVQAFLRQGGVAAGGGAHLPWFGEVRLLPLS